MTDRDKAEEYVNALLDKDDAELDKLLDENLAGLQLNEKQAGTLLGIIKGIGICSFLAGLKKGRPKWHKVADGDLPKKDERFLSNISIPVMTQSNGFAFYSFDNKKWFFQGKVIDVIAWCEIPKYTEG